MLRSLLLLLCSPFLTASATTPKDPEPIAYALTPEFDRDGLVALNVSVRFRVDAWGNAVLGWRDSWGGER